MHPLTPSHDATFMSTSSTNTALLDLAIWRSGNLAISHEDHQITKSPDRQILGFSDRVDADEPSARAVVLELHAAADLREQRVVLAAPHVEPGQELAPALAHEDRPAGDDVAVEPLHAETLRVAVAAVARRALTFLMSHDSAFRPGYP